MKKAKIIGIIALIILSVGTLLIISHNRKLGTTSSEIGGTLAIMVYDESLADYVKQDIIPKENYKLNRTKTHCTANGKIKKYNRTDGTITYSLTTADQCYVYFDTLQPYDILPGSNLAQTIVTLGTNNTMSTDNTWGIINENGHRYQGKKPDNYICFGSEEEICPEDNLYRLIGAFETKYDTDGDNVAESTGYLAKVQKYTMYGGTGMVFHSTNTKPANAHYPNSEIYPILNTNWHGSLDSTYQNQIANANWNLGGVQSAFENLTTDEFYAQERGTTVNSGVTETEKVFKIGIMYPSEYGYGVLAGNCERTKSLYYYHTDYNCYQKNWLFYTDRTQWTMTTWLSSSAAVVFNIRTPNGILYHDGTHGAMAVRPTFYLNPDIIVTEGYGTYEEPYRISL